MLKQIYEKSNKSHTSLHRFPLEARIQFGLRYLPKFRLNSNEYDLCKRCGISIKLLQGRLIFPIIDYFRDSEWIGLAGRDISGQSDIRYYNTEFQKSNILYSHPDIVSECHKAGSVILVEGYADAIRMWAEGMKNVVAIMGTSIGNGQIDCLNALGLPVLFCFDGDAPGQYKMSKIDVSLFRVELFVLQLEMDYDPDDWLKAGFLIPDPIPYAEWWVHYKFSQPNWEMNVDEIILNAVEFGFIDELLSYST